MNDTRANMFSNTLRLDAGLTEQVNQLDVLNLVAQTVTSNLDLKSMLLAISEAACHIFPETSISIATVNDDRTMIEFTMEYPATQTIETLSGVVLPFNWASPITIALFQKQTPVVIANAETEPMLTHLQTIMTRFQIKTVVMLPLITHNDVIGIVMFYRRNLYHPFSPKDVAFARTIAGQIAGVMHHARLFEQERQQRERAEILQDVSIILSSSLDEATVLQKILEQAHRVVLYDSSAIFLKKGDDLILSLGANVPERFLGRPVPLDSGTYPCDVFLTRQPSVVADTENDPHWDKWEDDSLIRSWMGVPLYVGEQGIGILTVNYHQPAIYSEDDARILLALGNHAALAIHNAQLYRQIHQEKQFFETLLLNSPVATVITGLDLRVTSWNPAAERLFGYSASEAIGQRIQELVVEERRYDETRSYLRHLQDGQAIREITQRRHKNGRIVEVELHESAVMIEGHVAAYIAQYHDITELVQARKNSEAANRAKSAFLANMSHELRTPLTAILGFSELLQQRSAIPPEEVAYLRTIHLNGEHLLLLLNNLLDLARLESGQIVLDERDFNLYRLLDELRYLLSARAEHEHVRLSFHRAPDVPQYIRTDEIKLHHVLLHLMTDILKFTSQGEVELSVTCGSTSSPHDEHAARPEHVEGRIYLRFQIVSRSLLPIRRDESLLPITRQFVRLIGSELRLLPDEAASSPNAPPDAATLCFAFDMQVGLSHLQAAPPNSVSKQTRQAASIEIDQTTIDWAALSGRSLQFWKRFEYAVTTVDMTAITACIREIQADAADAAELFEQLQHDFEYVKMLTLIGDAKTHAGGES